MQTKIIVLFENNERIKSHKVKWVYHHKGERRTNAPKSGVLDNFDLVVTVIKTAATFHC